MFKVLTRSAARFSCRIGGRFLKINFFKIMNLLPSGITEWHPMNSISYYVAKKTRELLFIGTTVLYRQPLPAFGPATVNDPPAPFGGHPF